MNFTNCFYNNSVSDQTRDFIELTKLNYHDVIDYSMQINGIMHNPYYMTEIFNHTIELGNVASVSLPDALTGNNQSLKHFYKLNEQRASQRRYSGESLSKQELASLLKSSLFTIKEEASKQGLTRRNIASPGGLYPIEIYYLNLNEEHLDIGAYYYNQHDGDLKLVEETENDDFINKVYTAFAVDDRENVDIDIKSCSGILILGASLNRVSFKYLDRGIRWAFTEAGAILHNLQLAGTALKTVGTCPCAGFFDDMVSDLIGFKSIDQLPIVSLVVGKV